MVYTSWDEANQSTVLWGICKSVAFPLQQSHSCLQGQKGVQDTSNHPGTGDSLVGEKGATALLAKPDLILGYYSAEELKGGKNFKTVWLHQVMHKIIETIPLSLDTWFCTTQHILLFTYNLLAPAKVKYDGCRTNQYKLLLDKCSEWEYLMSWVNFYCHCHSYYTICSSLKTTKRATRSPVQGEWEMNLKLSADLQYLNSRGLYKLQNIWLHFSKDLFYSL